MFLFIGEKKWGVSMYDSQNSLIANYTNPIIGDMKVQDVTPRVVDKYIQTLQKTPAVNTRTHHAKTDLVTNATIEKIIKLLRCALQAGSTVGADRQRTPLTTWFCPRRSIRSGTSGPPI